MNGGLISPSETKHQLKLGGRIHPNGAATSVMGSEVVGQPGWKWIASSVLPLLLHFM